VGLPVPYHLGGYSKLVKLLLVICSRLRAVVGNKDELFAFIRSKIGLLGVCNRHTFTPQHLKCLWDLLVEVIAGPEDAYSLLQISEQLSLGQHLMLLYRPEGMIRGFAHTIAVEEEDLHCLSALSYSSGVNYGSHRIGLGTHRWRSCRQREIEASSWLSNVCLG
jgi:hypothetical protein